MRLREKEPRVPVDIRKPLKKFLPHLAEARTSSLNEADMKGEAAPETSAEAAEVTAAAPAVTES